MTAKYTFIYEDNEEPFSRYPSIQNQITFSFEDGCTWIEVVEHFLHFLEAQYGYDLRSQVYYSLLMPTNNYDMTKAVGREMNRNVFESLLKKHGEELIPIYDSVESEWDNFDDTNTEEETDANPSGS